MSSLTTREYIGLRATLLASVDERYSCARCTSTYAGRPDQAERVAALQSAKACETVSTMNLEIPFAGRFAYRRCPGNFADPSLLHLIGAHHAFRAAGVLPFPGALMDQPNKVMEAFDVIDSFEAERALARAKKQRLRAGLGGAHGR